MRLLSTPRPSGSRAEGQVYAQLKRRLEIRGIPYTEQTFRLYPWFWPGIGAWLIVSRGLLALAAWQDWGCGCLAIALIGLLGGLVDVAFDFPLASWMGAVTGRNLLMHVSPLVPRREIIISAHYDTKTELLDHRQRMFFVRNLPVGIVLTVLIGVLGAFQGLATASAPGLAAFLHWTCVVLCVPLLILALGLGLNLSLGRLRSNPSQGAVDNGAACAILIELADYYRLHPEALQETKLTLALFGGEEVNMQGSRAYNRKRPHLRLYPSPQPSPKGEGEAPHPGPLPAVKNTALGEGGAPHPGLYPSPRPSPKGEGVPVIALNLEVMAQNGEYVLWEQDGISLRLWPNSEAVNQAIAQAVEQETGQAPLRVGPINSDGGSFNRAGIPATTLGTYDRALRDRGFHQSSDNLGRVVPERIPEAMRILRCFVENYDMGKIPFPDNARSE